MSKSRSHSCRGEIETVLFGCMAYVGARVYFHYDHTRIAVDPPFRYHDEYLLHVDDIILESVEYHCPHSDWSRYDFKEDVSKYPQHRVDEIIEQIRDSAIARIPPQTILI